MKEIKSKYLLFLLLIIGVAMSLFNGGNEVHFSNLDGKYLIKSIEFYDTGEWSFFKRGPIFTLIISSSFFLFGKTIEAAFWVSQIFYIGSIILVFYLGKEIFNKYVGFFSAFYALASIPLFKAGWDIDPGTILSFFLLLSILNYVFYLKDKNKINLFISSVSFGLAVLTKEAAFFFIIYPIILQMLIYEKNTIKINILSIIAFYLIFIVTLLPWILTVISYNQSVFIILGEFLPTGGASIGLYTNDGLIDFIKKILLEGIPTTINILFKYEPFFIPMVIGVLYSFYKSIFFNAVEHKKYLSILLTIFPVLAVYGLYLDGYRQLMPQLLILYISIGVVTFEILKLKKIYITIAFIIFLISASITYFLNSEKLNNYSILDIVQERVTGKFSLNIKTSGRMNEDIKVLSKWLNNNIEPESILLVGGVYDDSIKFNTNLSFQYKSNTPKYYEINTLINNNVIIDDEIIAITSLKKFRSNQFRYRNLFIIFKKDYIAFIENYINSKNKYHINYHGAKYNDKIVFPKLYNDIKNLSNLYFEYNGIEIFYPIKNFDYQDIFSVNEIFSLGDKISKNFNWLNTKDDLNWLKENYSDEYLSYKEYLSSYHIKIED